MATVSVVTPSLNGGAFLEQAIRSVWAQDYSKVEHIVVDGGSTDGSVDLLRKHEGELAYWVREKDRGQSDAINKGFCHATGSIFAWLNADDLLAPSAARIAVDYLSREPDVGAVYGDRIHIDAKGNVIGINRGPGYYAEMFRRNITLPQETVFFRRGVFEAVGGLREDLGFAMDFDLWCRMAKVTKFRHVPAFLGCFREHRSAKSVVFGRGPSSDSAEFLAEHREVYRRHFGRDLPGPLAAGWYRFLHKCRLAASWRSSARARDLARIRQITMDVAASS